MNRNPETARPADLKFKVGDLINLNEFEQPCARLVAVVCGIEDEYPFCKYLHAAKDLKPFKKGLRVRASDATKIEDFGVICVRTAKYYSCEETTDSIATYPGGESRYWQDASEEPLKGRRSLMAIAFPETSTK